jgi:hypothetical protein
MLAAAAPSPVHGDHARTHRPVRLRLWLPLTPLFWALAPLALLFAPFVWIAVPKDRRPSNPYAAAIALGVVLVSLSGTVIDVSTRDARIFIRIV